MTVCQCAGASMCVMRARVCMCVARAYTCMSMPYGTRRV